MWKLLLGFAIFQLAQAICPPNFDLVRDGECRGFVSVEKLTFDQAAPTAIDLCAALPSKVQGQPVIIRNQEQQQYWKDRAPATTTDGYLILGIVCNPATKKFEWADGSPIDFRPKEGYNGELDALCYPEYGWYMRADGYWNFATRGAYVQADIFCTVQLLQPPLNPDGCDNFEDDMGDGVCYHVGAYAEDWQDAYMVCKKEGAELASIHNSQENSFVRRLAVSVGAVNGVYLGASSFFAQEEGAFGWADGTPMDYQNYYNGFPKKDFGDCIAMDTSSTTGQWMNNDCTKAIPAACIRRQKVDPAPICSGQDYYEGQIILSPGFPNSAATPCDWFLEVPAGKRVQLQVIMLEANACCDSLVLYDGSLGSKPLASLSGSQHNMTYTTKDSNIMKVSWEPNGGVNVRGMAVTYRAV